MSKQAGAAKGCGWLIVAFIASVAALIGVIDALDMQDWF